MLSAFEFRVDVLMPVGYLLIQGFKQKLKRGRKLQAKWKRNLVRNHTLLSTCPPNRLQRSSAHSSRERGAHCLSGTPPSGVSADARCAKTWHLYAALAKSSELCVILCGDLLRRWPFTQRLNLREPLAAEGKCFN